MTALDGGHPRWCARPPFCTADPEPGLPISDGWHNSRPAPLPTGPVSWPLEAGVVRAYLTQAAHTTWPTPVYVVFHSSVHGFLAQMSVAAWVGLAAVVDQLVGLVDPPPARVDRTEMRLSWPEGKRPPAQLVTPHAGGDGRG